ncbi:IS3 family transposase [Streptomyces sp. NBC_01092]|uniref:IS3 family transposase n=1 Tax=Streptomyces sp. NBC_01092 TaxID=2903748 RepID=UPI0038674ED6|nr:IS3 family transposase [Streptomyces sp. NBC_01092]
MPVPKPARRSGRPGPRTVRDAGLTEKIAEVHERSRGTYGAARIHAVPAARRRELRPPPHRETDAPGCRRGHRTTIPDPRAAVRPDVVVRNFAADPAGLNSRWCGDITYVPTEEGWLYLATVIDIASRRVVGWSAADHLRTELVTDALRSACGRRRPTRPLIFHCDRGCQYTSQHFATLATELGIRPSVGRSGQFRDNALAESFFATIKRELLGTQPWPSRAAARTAIFDFIERPCCPIRVKPA